MGPSNLAYSALNVAGCAVLAVIAVVEVHLGFRDLRPGALE
jgi:hypothetical protein